MRDGDAAIGVVTVWANCEKATLAVEYSPVSSSTAYAGRGSKHVDHYKFPVVPMCGGDNAAAVAAFKTLCPSYGREDRSGSMSERVRPFADTA